VGGRGRNGNGSTTDTVTVTYMGMDVYGRAPTTETGTYFRRNVWGWHPLWNYVEDQHPDLASKVGYGHTNDGDGLGAEDSLTLANRLRTDVNTGRAGAYIDQRDAALADLPREDCKYCNATGTRTDAVGQEQGMVERGWCNGCDGTGTREPIERAYQLEIDDLREFAGFLEYCGGFSIH
jgi:hypothetical protein